MDSSRSRNIKKSKQREEMRKKTTGEEPEKRKRGWRADRQWNARSAVCVRGVS